MEAESLLILVVGFTGVAVLLLFQGCLLGSVPIHSLLYSSVWSLCICFSQSALGGELRTQPATTLVLFGAWWAFLAGATVPVITGAARAPGCAYCIRRRQALAVLYTLLALQWAGVLYEILHLDASARPLGVSAMAGEVAAIRTGQATNEIPLPPFLGTFRWSFAIYIPLALILRSRALISRRQLAAIYILAGVSALVHFTRAPVIMLSIVSFVAWVRLYRPSPRRVWIATGLIGVALVATFVAAQVAINQQTLTSTPLFRSLSAYFGTSPLAYEDILKGNFPRAPGFYSFDWLEFLLDKTGMHVATPGQDRPQIWFPIVTNVYTYLDVFTLDGGVTGALLGAAMVGALCSCVYRLDSRRTSLWTLSTYAYLCYGCLMTPINNEFIRINTLITLALSWCATWFIGYRRARAAALGFKNGEPRRAGALCGMASSETTAAGRAHLAGPRMRGKERGRLKP
jgi:hypothetical protein